MKEYAGKVLMLLEHHFPQDPRVGNEAYALTKKGYEVIVLAVAQPGERFAEEVNGVLTYRIPRLTLFNKSSRAGSSLVRRMILSVASRVGFVFEHTYFTLSCAILSLYILWKHGFDAIHAHNPPDTLFVVGALGKVLGKKFIFDQHDLSPELYLSRFGKDGGIIYRILLLAEKLSLRLSDLVIATNESYKEIEIQRGNVKPERVFVVRNGPDLDRVRLVSPDKRLKMMGKKILGYVGVMGPQDGVDYLLRAIKHLLYDLRRDDFYCVIIGSGDSFEYLKEMASELGIQDHVWFTGFVSDEDVLRYLSTADICVDPDPSSPLNDKSTWIKVMEYMALGKPIVSFDLKETRYTAQAAAIYVPPNDEMEFAKAIAGLMDDPAQRERMGAFGQRRIREELAWEFVSKNLIAAYGSIFRKS